ncbi:helix-turn-helix domain-containing protein [Nitrogeniibacter aestuarii]|uniref:helix-turn-helix domain-containing protein n=1 Tax=Nitrogeniibacter aestuarii TaxID=2815343 RepID=UPI001D0F8484|nr:helix-turn-helix domain-containing protein [Nitrogeniibacter aestuarii]
MQRDEDADPDKRAAHWKHRQSHIVTSDPCQHAESLPAWSQEYLQLEAGPFFGEIKESTFGPVQVFQETIDQVIDEKANPRRDSYTVGIPVRVTENGRWQGHELSDRSVMILKPNEELHFKTPKHSNILVTVITCCALDAIAEGDGFGSADDLFQRPHVVEVGDDIASNFRAALFNALSVSQNNPGLLEHEAVRNDLSDSVMHSVFATLTQVGDFGKRLSNGQSVQRSIVERARTYILANRQRALSVAELCEHLRMSRRGVHHAFMNVLGVNPVTFLRYVRLHEVRKALLDPGCRESISTVAANWGFWHMGMFGQYYKQLFHETPSDTTKRIRGPLDSMSRFRS